MSVTIRPTSITVTATASRSEPNGSPTRWATTSAWCTAASTAAPRINAIPASTTPGGLEPHVTASASKASGGTTSVQRSDFRRVIVTQHGLRGRRLAGGP